ncbi:MAG TPA: CPBP family intramembrane glutamic endopeptidase [Edaphocola sp.]|nr:CPBP family intramembrane glutamic endopeptidase [Edaphocola sp.]
MKKLVKTFPILSYLVLTFTITWTFWWIPLFYELSNDITSGVFFIGGLGPPIAAFILIHIISDVKIRINSIKLFWGFFILCVSILIWKYYTVEKGGADWNGFYPKLSDFRTTGIILTIFGCLFLGLNASNATNKSLKENFLKTLLFDKSKRKWYLFALLFYPLLYVSSYFLGKLFDLETSEKLFDIKISVIPGFLLIVFIAGGTEEFGWRGFLLKELQKKYNPLIATLFIGFFWSLWHLPMYFNGVYSTEGFSAYLPSFIHTFQISLLFTWLYNKSGYSILAVMILHAMNNTVGSIFGASYIPAMIIAVLFMIIIIIDNKMWKRKNYANEIYSYGVK